MPKSGKTSAVVQIFLWIKGFLYHFFVKWPVQLWRRFTNWFSGFFSLPRPRTLSKPRMPVSAPDQGTVAPQGPAQSQAVDPMPSPAAARPAPVTEPLTDPIAPPPAACLRRGQIILLSQDNPAEAAVDFTRAIESDALDDFDKALALF